MPFGQQTAMITAKAAKATMLTNSEYWKRAARRCSHRRRSRKALNSPPTLLLHSSFPHTAFLANSAGSALEKDEWCAAWPWDSEEGRPKGEWSVGRSPASRTRCGMGPASWPISHICSIRAIGRPARPEKRPISVSFFLVEHVHVYPGGQAVVGNVTSHHAQGGATNPEADSPSRGPGRRLRSPSDCTVAVFDQETPEFAAGPACEAQARACRPACPVRLSAR